MSRQTARLLPLLATAAVLCACAGSTRHHSHSDDGTGELNYPAARTTDQVDVYHGVEVADPYRWMEDETSAETRRWVDAQQDLLEDYVGALPNLDALKERCREIREFDAFGTPTRKGEQYFFTRRPPGALDGAIWVQQGLAGEPRMLIDFVEVIDEPSHRSSGFSASPDGRYVVWASMDPKGWGWLDVARVEDGRVLNERIEGVGGNSAIWTRDGKGFFYMAYGAYDSLMAGAAEPRARILYHRVGSDPTDDRVVYVRDDRPTMLFIPKLSDDGRYLVVALNDGTRAKNEIVYLDLEGEGAFATLIDDADARYTFEGNVGRRLFFQTTLDAPRRRVIAIDLDRPGRSNWTEIVPQRDTTISAVSHIGGRLVVRTTEHARPIVEVWTVDGDLERTLDLPAIGSVSGFSDDPDGPLAFYRLNNLYDPGTIYRVDLRNGESEVHRPTPLPHDPDDYEIRQVFYESKDGTRVPMFLAHRKDVSLRGDNPVYMYGYGHGGWVAFPWYQPHLVAWMDMGGVYALPGLRGGGEYGTEWQDAGTRLNKTNTIDDFIAAAEWLVEHGYTSPQKLVANGGSASGVVPAAAAVGRPDLFAAAVIDFPFLDMLRYHEFTTIKGWTSGYGSSADPEEFEVLRSYSPLHTIEKGRCYPAMLTIVGEKDTATVPMHGYKFTAALQAAQGCDNPVMLDFIPAAGHYSYGTTSAEAAATEAEILAFLIRALELDAG